MTSAPGTAANNPVIELDSSGVQPQAKKNPPSPGDFIDTFNRRSVVGKIQDKNFRVTTDVLASVKSRNNWFDFKINDEWFCNHGMFQEKVFLKINITDINFYHDLVTGRLKHLRCLSAGPSSINMSRTRMSK